MISNTTTIHGVFLEIFNCGVLLTGKSGIGKSELALGLIDRQHRLIADDVVEFTRENSSIMGQCPEMLQDLLEVRGLGILNIKLLFGNVAIAYSRPLNLIIKLVALENDFLQQVDRLQGGYEGETVLACSIPSVTIPVTPGRSLSILIETAVRNHLLRLSGEITSNVLIERQAKSLMHSSGKDDL